MLKMTMKSSHTLDRYIKDQAIHHRVLTLFPLSRILFLRHFVDDDLLEIVKLSVPLVQGCVPRCALVVFVQLQHPGYLHHPATVNCYQLNCHSGLTWSILPLIVLSRMQLTRRLSTSVASMFSSPEMNLMLMRV